MTWVAIGAAAVTVVGGVYSANKASDDSDRASRRALAASGSANQALQQGYYEAEERLSPFIASEAAANKQLMAEMGLTPDYGAQIESTSSRIAELNAQMEALGATYSGGGESGFADGNLDNYIKFKDSISPTRSYLSRKKSDKARRKARRLEMQRIADARNVAKQIQAEEAKLAELQQQAQAPAPEAGTAYMKTPGYQGAIDEGVRAVNQGSANEGALYSGARGLALRDVGQSVQQSYYTNYMNILQNMANPVSTTNLSNIGIQQAGNVGRNTIAAQNQASQFDLMGTQAENAATADIIGGITSGIGAYMNRPQGSQSMPAYNGSGINQTDYSAWV